LKSRKRGGRAQLGEKLVPHPNQRKVYFAYLGIVSIPLLIGTILPILLIHSFAPDIWRGAWPYLFIPLGVVLAILGFLAWWLTKYYRTISFTLGKEEVVVEHGVWWRMKHMVPYARVMSVDVVQGPISRRFGLGRVDIHTAGYTGSMGGTAGPGTRRAEASIWGVPNFLELRDVILGLVRQKPLFAAGKADVGAEILQELKKIRRVLEKG
jgi:hypothetical protein